MSGWKIDENTIYLGAPPELVKEKYKAMLKAREEKPPTYLPRCPFKRGLGGPCTDNCMLSIAGKCALLGLDGKIEEKKNGRCPLRDFAPCYGKDCALYNSGCTIAKIRKEK